ncbi:MAG: DsbA family protein [Fimbriimonas sp.]|nr:DsbA family protein [Fimbriimonas sp.]
MNSTIPVAHDFICPWCWVGFLQAKQLEEEFGVKFDWIGYELFPIELEWPDYPPAPEPPANKPPVLSRFEFLLAADDIEMPAATKPKKMRTYNAHQAVEYAKTEGVADQLVEALYRAYWERGEEINDLSVIIRLASGIVVNLDDLASAIETKRFKDNVVGFDEPAYTSGIYNVPTFTIGEKRYAEQPLSRLRKALREAS